MKGRAWLHAARWFRSVHAKLFMATGLFTSLLTVGVAYTIISNSRQEILDYTRGLAIQTGSAVAGEIRDRDEHFLGRAKLKSFLESFAGADKSIDQIDLFKAEVYSSAPGDSKVSLVTSSAPDEDVIWSPDLGRFMNTPGQEPTSRLIELLPGDADPSNPGRTSRGWEVFVPIPNPAPGEPVIGLIRTYCDMERWDVVWEQSLQRTYRLLPFILAGEFVLLWLILGWLLNRPLKTIGSAMARLESGDHSARTDVERQDEMGQIAGRFNLMATQLEKAAKEREALIQEIQGLNTGLQSRIDAALAELQAKNRALEDLLTRIALLREELAQQERLAIAGQLTAAFAHEVGTPLNLVNSHLQLLLAQEQVADKTRERLGTIHTQITRVGDIVRKLLVTTRRPDIHPEPVPCEALVVDLQRLWNPTLGERGIRFTSAIPDPCLLLVDRRQMEQLFLNLVNNAVDALPNGGHIHLRVWSAEASARWEVALEDDGMGIPENTIPLIFKPLFTTKPEGRGTGLGLAICREIVRAHGGDIRAESQPGQGATFRFTLPGA